MIQFSLQEIEEKLKRSEFPFSGSTLNGTAEFCFLRPSFYCGVAVHAGNRVRPGLEPYMSATAQERFREEDPFTERFIEKMPIRIVARDSRFQYDLNRQPHRAIYSLDKKIWGIRVWKKELSKEERNRSLVKHREFHDLLDLVVDHLLAQGRKALILDMHSFCYQRDRTLPWYLDPKPEINIGSKAVNRDIFGQTIDNFKQSLSGLNIDGHPIRVVENELFGGGYLARRLNKAFPDRLLVLAVEYKKIFMNEATGELNDEMLNRLIEHFDKAVKKLVQSSFYTTP